MFHVVWILCWFIASVDWAVAFNDMHDYLNNYMKNLKNSDCFPNNSNATVDDNNIQYVQAQIAVVSASIVIILLSLDAHEFFLSLCVQVFGFLIQFVLAANIGWLVIDTSWYINWRASRGHAHL